MFAAVGDLTLAEYREMMNQVIPVGPHTEAEWNYEGTLASSGTVFDTTYHKVE